jgi:hypothetical protein
MACLRWFGEAFLLAALAAACSGSSSSGVLGAGSDGATNGDASTTTESGTGADGTASGTDSSNAGDGTSKGQDSSAMDSSAVDSSATNDGLASPGDASDAASDAPAAPCPDVHGAYTITAVDATGCGNSFNVGARQCIRQGQSAACGIQFQSTGGSTVAINGEATLKNDGSFSDAALTEGTLNRTGCTGTWDPGTSSLTVDCGGTGSSQACVLSLQRTGATCN